MYIFTNSLGCFAITNDFKIKESILFDKNRSIEAAEIISKKKQLKEHTKLLSKYPDSLIPENNAVMNKILQIFKKDSKKFYDVNIANTKKLISDSVDYNNLIVQAVRIIEDLDKTANSLTKRIREWYSFYLPEASENIGDNYRFIKTILEKDKETLIKDFNVDVSMGSSLSKNDVDAILDIAGTVENLYSKRKDVEIYLNSVMKIFCPNMLEITGTMIGAKLIAQAGKIKNMVMMPASTIQLLGAEQALFRHIKTGAKPPKYGILLNHKLVTKQKKANKGKAAKSLADKISIAVKVDYFKGEFIGGKLKEELEKKFMEIQKS